MKLQKFRRGLTLIELAIVTAVISFLLIGIFKTYTDVSRLAKESDPKNSAPRREVFYAIENMRSTLAQVFYLQGQKRLLFIGKNSESPTGGRADMVSFAANHANSEDTGSPSVREVSFFLKPMNPNPKPFQTSEPQFYHLIRREDEMVDNDPLNGGTEHILLSYVKNLQFKYSQRGDKWEDKWDTADFKKIPKLIRIEIIVLIGNDEYKYEMLSYPGLFFK
jgi:general secretion pathway protein J